jgi:hypothetical protein
VLSAEQAEISASEELLRSIKQLYGRGWMRDSPRGSSKRYAGLVNLPPGPPGHAAPPAAVSCTPNGRRPHAAKIALIVVDGLAWTNGWSSVNHWPRRARLGRFREQAVFAWIPSLTSVSRQAAFAGKAPVFFPNSIQTTDREPALWAQFWADQGCCQTRSST